MTDGEGPVPAAIPALSPFRVESYLEAAAGGFVAGPDGRVSLEELRDRIEQKAQELKTLEGPVAVEPENSVSSLVDLLAHGLAGLDMLLVPGSWSDADRASVRHLFFAPAHEPEGLFRAWRGEPLGSVIGYCSSASTGAPKVASVSWRTQLPAARQFAQVLNMTASDTVLSTSPIHHGFATEGAVLNALQAGASLVLAPARVDPDVLSSLIAEHNVSIIVGVPAVFERLLQSQAMESLPSLRLCISGGEALPARLMTKWRARTEVPLRQEYGSIEIGLIAFDRLGIPRSVGVPHPGIGVRFEPVPEDELNSFHGAPVGEVGDAERGPGEMVLRGRTERQLHRLVPGTTDQVQLQHITDAWIHTGDIGFRGDQGELFITGRRGRVISILGQKLDPFEVEETIESHPGVRSCLVRVEETRGGDRALYAYVMADPEFSARDAMSYLRASLSPHKVPAEIRVVDALPTLASGKRAR